MHIASESAREAGNGKERMGHMKKTLFFVCLFFVFYKYQLMYYKFNIHKSEFIGKHWIYYSFWCVRLLVLSHADEIWHNNKLKNI